jgi:hypothetical protein
MREKCEYNYCNKDAEYVLVYWGNNQFGERLPEPDEQLSCLEHLTGLIKQIGMLPSWITDISESRKYPELLDMAKKELGIC